MTELEKPRTPQQNKSLHLWLTLLAESLNAAGYDMKVFFEAADFQVHLPWSPVSCKELLWRPSQRAMTGKESTTELSTVDPTIIHEALMRRISEVTGIEYIPWPSEVDSGPDLVP